MSLDDPNTAELSFVADSLEPGELDVTHIFTLTVTDNDGGTHSATVTVTVTPNARPEAHAGPDQTVTSGDTVTLDGSGSTDSGDGSVTGYTWTRTGGTGDNTLVLTGATTIRPTFTADILAPGASDVTHIFSLVVTDNNGAVSLVADTVTVTIKAATVNIAVSSSELVVQEGGTGIYRVRLDESPRQNVFVVPSSSHGDVVLKNRRLAFNAVNWAAWQNVEISAVADSDNDDDTRVIRHKLVNANGVTLGESGVVTVTVREKDPILSYIGNFFATRAATLLNNQPGLTSFLKQDETASDGSGAFTFSVTDGHMVLDGGFVRNGVWGEVTGSYAGNDFGDTKSVLGAFGFHRKYSQRFLAGVMLQFDLAKHDLSGNAGTIDGTGWLVGPYFAARHDTQPLYFEGRLLYGQSDNDIRFIDPGAGIGTRSGSFDTTRYLAQLRVNGEISLSDGNEGSRLIPYADARWIEDRAAAFVTGSTTGFRISVPGQKVSVSQLELGSNVEVPIAVSDGAMTFTGGLGVIYSNTEGDFISSVSRSRGRGEIGFSYGLDDNIQIDFNSFYDGIGHSGYEGYGLSVSAEMKF